MDIDHYMRLRFLLRGDHLRVLMQHRKCAIFYCTIDVYSIKPKEVKVNNFPLFVKKKINK